MKGLFEKIRKKAGFSILELLITLGIFAILMAIVSGIIFINLTASRRVKARSYVREETAFLLNIFKKDVRNAESLSYDEVNEILSVNIIDADATLRTYTWQQEDNQIVRRLESDGSISYRAPGDIIFDDAQDEKFTMRVDCTADNSNCLVKVSFRAWTPGMPGEEGGADQQWLKKEIAVSTRNFN